MINDIVIGIISFGSTVEVCTISGIIAGTVAIKRREKGWQREREYAAYQDVNLDHKRPVKVLAISARV
jgi:hypothetical protein